MLMQSPHSAGIQVLFVSAGVRQRLPRHVLHRHPEHRRVWCQRQPSCLHPSQLHSHHAGNSPCVLVSACVLLLSTAHLDLSSLSRSLSLSLSRSLSLSPCFQLNQAAGTTLVQLSVSDKDSPRNGPPFEFRIVSGNDGKFFTLDQTGTLKSNRVFDPKAPREFTLEIQVGWFFFFFFPHIFWRSWPTNTLCLHGYTQSALGAARSSPSAAKSGY